jgi:hypothetical protein
MEKFFCSPKIIILACLLMLTTIGTNSKTAPFELSVIFSNYICFRYYYSLSA